MSTNDPNLHLVALGVAKITYGTLKVLRRHLGGDLDLGLIGFAVVMRTRRDLFQLVERHGLNEEAVSKIASERGFYTSINEISQYTDINRATVRRKMQKLEDLGILEKVDGDKWHLKDFLHSEQARSAMLLRELLQNYVLITNKLDVLLPEGAVPTMQQSLVDLGGIEAQTLPEVAVPTMQQSLADLGAVEARALLEDEIARKAKRALQVDH